MGKFWVAQGNKLISTGFCQDGMEEAQAGPGQTAGTGDPPAGVAPEVFPTVEKYDMKRKREYPTIGDQLDMLWHAMDTNQIPRAQQFYSTIKAVKDKYPKPNGQ